MSARGKAMLQFAIMLAIAGLLYKFAPHRIMAGIVAVLAVVVLVCGLFIPSAFRAIERFGQTLGAWAATGLTWGLLVPTYYLIFVPARIGLKLQGKDPMHREFPTTASSYWIPRPPVRGLDQYRKQH